MMSQKMIGNKALLGQLIGIIIILLMIFSAFWVYEEIKYSWKIHKELNLNNATCYLERGLFKLPLAEICTYNKTFIITKTEFNEDDDD